MTYKTSIVAQKIKWSAGDKQLQGTGELFCGFPGRHYVYRYLLEAERTEVTLGEVLQKDFFPLGWVEMNNS